MSNLNDEQILRLMEQAAAVIERGSRILLHGADAPVPPDRNVTNGRKFQLEVNAFLAAVDEIEASGVVLVDPVVRTQKRRAYRQRETTRQRAKDLSR